MIYKNSIDIKNDNLIFNLKQIFQKYSNDCDELYIVGSVADRIVSEYFNTNIIYRDKFKDIDYIYIGNNQKLLYNLKINSKYDCVNKFYKNNIYKTDSSICEVIYNIKSQKAWYSDGYIKTITTGWLYPPIWSDQKLEDIFQGTLDCPDKPFIRCKQRGLKISNEMLLYMNKLMEYVYNIDKKWIQSLATFSSNYNIDYNLDWSSNWKEFFNLKNKNKSKDEIYESKKYIYTNIYRLYY